MSWVAKNTEPFNTQAFCNKIFPWAAVGQDQPKTSRAQHNGVKVISEISG